MFRMIASSAVVALLLGPVALLSQAAADHHAENPGKDIVETAVEAGSFKTLVAAVQAAGLADTLKGDGPFTVFAPTDEAFARLPEGTVETLLREENRDQLRSILLYHVVPGKNAASDVVKSEHLRTAEGSRLTIKVEEGKVHVDSAKVVRADIHARNGIIHVIDAVVLPNAAE